MDAAASSALWAAVAVAVGLGCGACRDKDPTKPHVEPSPELVPAGVDVEVEVGGAIVYEGNADRPAYGLYQPPMTDETCIAARRVAAIQGADVFLDVVFAGEYPVVGAQVVAPGSPDSIATDWTAATWRDADGQPFAAYGGVATLGAFGQDAVVVTLVGATLCHADQVGALADGTWATHTTDCAPADEIVFRTVEPLPFDLDRAPYCAEGRADSWVTPGGDHLCSELAEPCG